MNKFTTTQRSWTDLMSYFAAYASGLPRLGGGRFADWGSIRAAQSKKTTKRRKVKARKGRRKQ